MSRGLGDVYKRQNENCLTEAGRDPGGATFCSAVSEPIGGSLVRGVGTGGEDMWSTPVCLQTQQQVTEHPGAETEGRPYH